MIVDTSAVLAILLGEEDAPAFASALEQAAHRRISAANWFEAAIVIESRSEASGGREFDLFIRRSGIEIVDVTREQAELARYAYMLYGKGRNPAGLNFGDCFAYALSKSTGEPLLFKGDDFGQTDVLSALPPADQDSNPKLQIPNPKE